MCGKTKINLRGQRFGRLIVLKESDGRPIGGRVKWDCLCDCGNMKSILSSSLRKGDTTSCGCFRLEQMRTRVIKHGMSGHKLFFTYHGMMQRCYYPKNKCYHRYGGRGIRVCSEWKKSFERFVDWAKNNGWHPHLVLDRINNNKGYSPKNCQWITNKENCRKTTKCVFITYDGYRKTLSEWAEITKQPVGNIAHRKRMGWSPEECLFRIGKSKRVNKKICRSFFLQ